MLANFQPGMQEGYVNYDNDERAPLLLIAGGEDHVVPASITESNFKHYRNSSATTDYHEFAERSHYTVGRMGGRWSLTPLSGPKSTPPPARPERRSS